MIQAETDRKMQVVYFSHGGGPLPILGDPGHKTMIDFMTRLPQQLKRPDLILVVSAHWEERAATLLGAKNPPMFYDYYGFPEESYEIQYPAPGKPDDAKRIAKLLTRNKIASAIDPERGFDHGLFIPLKLMYPAADIPCLQLSLLRGLDPGVHIALGKALRDLQQENILVIGSGFSFHNMNGFLWDGVPRKNPANDAFQDWLIETCTGQFSQSEREQRLVEWEKAPNARYCHPREEHLLPVHVCQGLADKQGEVIFDDYILGIRSVGFLWK
jgi:4,5-DOPA dioxygenase extradiol